MNIRNFKAAVALLPDSVDIFTFVPPLVAPQFGARLIMEWMEGDELHTFELIIEGVTGDKEIRHAHFKRVPVPNPSDTK